jgi:hypothetical protein
MTIDALRGPVDRPRDPSSEPVAVGASDQNIFLCPTCTRPLAVGASRCIRCGTRLVAGVPLLRVGGFVGLGLVAGFVIGGGLMAATVVNQRLLADGDLLARALAGGDPSAAEIAPLLRGLATNAAFGDRLVPAVASWDAGVAVSQGLAAFYESIARVADEGLAASLTNERAYADAGRKMLVILDGLTDLDAASRGLAASVDTELPALVPAQ